MPLNSDEPRRVKTVDTVFDIIDTVVREESATIPTIADELGLARSTVHGHLTTLESKGLLVKEGREYRLSLQFFKYGTHVINGLDIISVVKPSLELLADETGETVWLALGEHGEYVLVDKVAGEQGIQTKGKIGRRYPMHAGAVGKVFLSLLDDEAVQERYDESPERVTENTITDINELLDDLEEIREQGVGFSTGEVTEGIRGVACPIVTEDIVAAILVSGPANRLHGSFFREDIPDLLRGVANSVELELTYR